MIGLRLASQRVMARAARELESGRTTWFISLGSPMAPSIKVIQRVELRPLRPEESLNGRVALPRLADGSGCIGSQTRGVPKYASSPTTAW